MKTRKLISILLCVCMVIGLSVQICGADNENASSTNVTFVYRVNKDKTSVTITGTEKGKDRIFGTVVIPSKIDGYTVTHIGNSAFASYNLITDVIIPDTVVQIGNNAFQDCTILANITLSKNITAIRDDAFGGCSSLKSITLPSSIETIGAAVFASCTSLKEINVDKNNKNYTSVDGVLFNKDKTTIVAYPNAKSSEYTIPDNVIVIERFAFSGCISLESITIPNTVTLISGAAFHACSSLKSVNIPDSVEVIHEGAFGWCDSLESITIPNSVFEMSEYIFIGCKSLTSVTLSRRITSIGKELFKDCTSLTSITIPSKVTSIGDDAFRGCIFLKDVIIPDTVTSIGNRAFRSCRSLELAVVDKSVAHQYAIDNDIDYVLYEMPKLKQISSKRISNAEIYYGSEFKLHKRNYISHVTTEDDTNIILALEIPKTDMSVLADANIAYIEFELYVSDVTLCDSFEFEITSSGDCDEDEYQWTIQAKDLKEGWNTVQYSVYDNPMSILGNPNLKKIDFIRLFMVHCKPGLQLMFDELRIVEYGY